MARLYVKTQKGQLSLGTSAEQTGRFTIEITCPATVLFIEKAGYRLQQLSLNEASLPDDRLVGVIIPLVAIDQPGFDRPYFQMQQTHFVQDNSKRGDIRPQHNAFVINDALSGRFLQAKACFYLQKMVANGVLTRTTRGS